MKIKSERNSRKKRKRSKPEVFIIESLTFMDEKKNRCEKNVLSHILNIRNKAVKYYYIRTHRELIRILKRFKASRYRYLHLSCHGSENAIYTTLNRISFRIFGKLITPYLDKKRLFLSSCSVANEQFAKTIFQNSQCISVVGPAIPIDFGVAALLWASFYHFMFVKYSHIMKNNDVKEVVQSVVDLYKIPMNVFVGNKSRTYGYRRYQIMPR